MMKSKQNAIFASSAEISHVCFVNAKKELVTGGKYDKLQIDDSANRKTVIGTD